MADSADLFAPFDAAEREIQEARRQLEARAEALERAREELSRALGGNVGSSPPPAARQRSRAGTTQKASQAHLDAISDYLARQGPTRQADIGKALGLNSGTVSIAVKQLEEDDTIESLPDKVGGSLVWAVEGTTASHSPAR